VYVRDRWVWHSLDETSALPCIMLCHTVGGYGAGAGKTPRCTLTTLL
jgi:hypothetical protein